MQASHQASGPSSLSSISTVTEGQKPPYGVATTPGSGPKAPGAGACHAVPASSDCSQGAPLPGAMLFNPLYSQARHEDSPVRPEYARARPARRRRPRAMRPAHSQLPIGGWTSHAASPLFAPHDPASASDEAPLQAALYVPASLDSSDYLDLDIATAEESWLVPTEPFSAALTADLAAECMDYADLFTPAVAAAPVNTVRAHQSGLASGACATPLPALLKYRPAALEGAFAGALDSNALISLDVATDGSSWLVPSEPFCAAFDTSLAAECLHFADLLQPHFVAAPLDSSGCLSLDIATDGDTWLVPSEPLCAALDTSLAAECMDFAGLFQP